jgi:hypothetical protein
MFAEPKGDGGTIDSWNPSTYCIGMGGTALHQVVSLDFGVF